MSATATDPIPVRALNQVTYCPRLYYLQYVEAVMPTNEHVEGGLFEHRRVTAPDLAHRTRREGDADRTRSAALSSNVSASPACSTSSKNGTASPTRSRPSTAPPRATSRAGPPSGTTTPCSSAPRGCSW